jgi:hypothetical protein
MARLTHFLTGSALVDEVFAKQYRSFHRLHLTAKCIGGFHAMNTVKAIKLHLNVNRQHTYFLQYGPIRKIFHVHTSIVRSNVLPKTG